jgi:hypothetical protein
MKAFFSTTPRAKTQFKSEIDLIYKVMRKLGLDLTDDIIENVSEHDFYSWDAIKSKQYYDHTISTIKTSEIAIFEVSVPSLGVGHLIGQSLNQGVPVVVLFTKGKKPFMLESAQLDKVILVEYTPDTLESGLSDAISFAKEKMDVRFNFIVSPKIIHYLEWIASHRNIPKSVFLRNLIEENMKKDKEYKGN